MKTFLHVLLGGVIGGVLVALLGSNGYMGRYSFVTQDVVTDGGMGKYLGDTNTNLSLGGDGMGGVGTDGSNDLKGGTDGGDGGGGEEMGGDRACPDEKVNWNGPNSIVPGQKATYTFNNKMLYKGNIVQCDPVRDIISLEEAYRNIDNIKIFDVSTNTQKTLSNAIVGGVVNGTYTIYGLTRCEGMSWSYTACPKKIKIDGPSVACNINLFATNPHVAPGEINFRINKTPDIKDAMNLICNLESNTTPTYKGDWSYIAKDITNRDTTMFGKFSQLPLGTYRIRCGFPDFPYYYPGECNNYTHIVGPKCNGIRVNGAVVNNTNPPTIVKYHKLLTVSCENKKLPTIIPELVRQEIKGTSIVGLIGDSQTSYHTITCEGGSDNSCSTVIHGAQSVCGNGVVEEGEQCDRGTGGKSCPYDPHYKTKQCDRTSCLCVGSKEISEKSDPNNGK